MKKVFLLHLITFISICCIAQETDSANNILNEVVVTATRTQRKLSNVAVPQYLWDIHIPEKYHPP